MTRGPRLYFSFRSPYTWMAVERLRAARSDVDELIEFIPYWDPDPDTDRALTERGAEFHYVQMSKAKHLYLLQDTKRLAQRYGLTMRWPIDIEPWWEVPHLAYLKAVRLGAGPAFFAAVMAARWQRGENICEPATVRAIGDALGLDGAALATATEDPEIRALGVDHLERAYHDDVFGIPYFRVGRHRFWGLDRLDDFLGALPSPVQEEDPLAGVPAAVQAATRGYDTDTAGGCG